MNSLRLLSACSAAVLLLSGCATNPPAPAPRQALTLNKLIVSRGNDTDWLTVDYDVAGYGVGRLSVAAGKTAQATTCSNYTSAVDTGTAGGVTTLSARQSEVCDGPVVSLEKAARADTYTLTFALTRLNALTSVASGGGQLMLPDTSVLQTSQVVTVPPGQSVSLGARGATVSQ